MPLCTVARLVPVCRPFHVGKVSSVFVPFCTMAMTVVVYHLHGETGWSMVCANGKQNSHIGNFGLGWRGFCEVVVPSYSIEEFKSHFHMTKTTFEVLARELVATGAIPRGNRFGRKRSSSSSSHVDASHVTEIKKLAYGLELVSKHAIRDSASPRHLELFSNKVKTEKHNVTKLRGTWIRTRVITLTSMFDNQ